jgi:hypothetical protein
MTTLKTVTRTAAIAAATGFAALTFAGPAAADEDIYTGGAFCSTIKPSCDPTSPNITVPDGSNQVKLDFTQNPNPCGGDLTVSIEDDTGKPIPLGQSVDTTPGAHKINVTPTCSQLMSSWGGVIHATYTTAGGATTGTGQTVSILQPSTIYKAAHGAAYTDANGNEVFKPTGAKVQLVGPEFCTGDWCHIVGTPEVTGQAWIYAGVDQNGNPFISRP